jgi:hypothetical protein
VKWRFLLILQEFVAKLPYPLSSDVFSSFEAQKENNEEATEATIELLCSHVPTVSAKLEKLVRRQLFRLTQSKETLHSEGINMRLLGLVLTYATGNKQRSSN